ncbi:MAG: hypothetical protein PUH99_01420 [Firmicutes bacterium]|nr:hypothetical protein [Bacillota bacterium]MDY5530857.1 hypothetical protein [Pumilibacteraceae bacterium]
MKQLTCEMCGSTDLVKQDGFFVCQTCGTKYSVEEAKKMMIEGTVDVQGTVKVDNSQFVEKCLANARRSYDKEDWEEVEKYYNMVEQNEPSNIEAIFFSAYGKARLSMTDDNIFKRKQICDVFCNSISIIDDNYNVENSAENQKIITEMNKSLLGMYNTSFVYTKERRGDGVETDNRHETYYLFAKMAFAFIDSLENIIRVDDQLIYWKMIYQHRKYLADNKGLVSEARNQNLELALEVGEKIREKDPDFDIEEVQVRVEARKAREARKALEAQKAAEQKEAERKAREARRAIEAQIVAERKEAEQKEAERKEAEQKEINSKYKIGCATFVAICFIVILAIIISQC